MSMRVHRPAQLTTSSFTPAPFNLVQRKCACGGSARLSGECNSCQKDKLISGNVSLIQPKLEISQPNDKYEQEADRVADEVMRMPEPGVQRQVKPGEEKEVIQRKSIASKIKPLVQRQVSDEEDEEQVQLKSNASSGTIQRQEPDGKPKSNEEETKEALKKTGEAFLKTAPGKAIVEKGKEVATTLPSTVITGTAAVGAVSALIATNKALPIQAPAIPLDRLHPGLSMRITVEGPLRAPTKAMISFSGKFGLPKRQGRQNPVKTESEKLREENARMQREQFEFRESLRTPEEKARDNQRLVDQLSKRLALPGLKSQEAAPVVEKKREETAIQRKETNNSAKVATDTSMIREVTQSAGQPLDTVTRGFMEQRFGHDFSQVRIHTDSKAADSAKSINARAYTLGQNIVFGSGQHAPHTLSGQRLLAHELTHVIQQLGGNIIEQNIFRYRIKSQKEIIQRKKCDPLIQDCPDGSACFDTGSNFECLLTEKGAFTELVKKILETKGGSINKTDEESLIEIVNRDPSPNRIKEFEKIIILWPKFGDIRKKARIIEIVTEPIRRTDMEESQLGRFDENEGKNIKSGLDGAVNDRIAIEKEKILKKDKSKDVDEAEKEAKKKELNSCLEFLQEASLDELYADEESEQKVANERFLEGVTERKKNSGSKKPIHAATLSRLASELRLQSLVGPVHILKWKGSHEKGRHNPKPTDLFDRLSDAGDGWYFFLVGLFSFHTFIVAVHVSAGGTKRRYFEIQGGQSVRKSKRRLNEWFDQTFDPTNFNPKHKRNVGSRVWQVYHVPKD